MSARETPSGADYRICPRDTDPDQPDEIAEVWLEADARLIVRAVNNHEALLAALEAGVATLTDDSGDYRAAIAAWLGDATTAIEQVKGDA